MKLTLEKYKTIDAIMSDNIPELDKTLYCICALWDYAPEELDKENPLKVVKMAAKLEKLFKFKISAPTIIGIYKINYDISNITFGQYIELSYFFQGNIIENSNFIVASVAKSPFKSSHVSRAKYFLNKHVGSVVGAMNKVRAGFIQINKEFGSLFGLDGDMHEKAQTDSFMQYFNNRYGWIFSAEVLAKYNNISIDEAYNLPVKRALNDLVYLKAKSKYEYLLTKK